MPDPNSYLPGLIGPVGIQANGVQVLYPRPILNFVGSGFTITDDGARLNFNLPSGGGGITASSTDTLTNKSIDAATNTLTVTSGAAGDLLVHDGTKFVRLPKGTALQGLRVNAGATGLEFAAIAGGSTPTGTGLAKVVGGAFVGAAATLVDADVNAAAAIAGSKISPDFSASTTIVGGLRGTPVNNTTTGTINDLTVAATTSVVTFSGAGPLVVTGFTGGANGRILVIVNNSGGTLTINNEAAGSTAANRIHNAYATALVLQDQVATMFVYSTTTSRWHTLISI